jgi:predicted RNA-binding Zn ribbon-like protein
VTDLRLIEEFLNTLDERTFRRHGVAHAGGDRLTGPAACKAWLHEHGLIAGGTTVTGDDLAAVVRLRTALRRTLAGEPGTAAFPLELRQAAGGLTVAATGPQGLTAIVETVAAALLRGEWARLKMCAAPDCRWVFHDTSRGGAGRWCSMAVCGNRSKTRAYRRGHAAGPG